ncbi:tRNA pseudouridine(55) synthase TruB [Candidatus Saccharibacteria bacterium]|nr:tRNA pseudouridine(55) synthase TruB [Candidatus Saccharibacteria bacterium]
MGWTSFDVVAKVRNILLQEYKTQNSKSAFTSTAKLKVGHTGTLDPLASGLMVLVLGKFTKRATEFSKLDKIYEAELILGATSTTGDREGELTQKSTLRPSKVEVKDAVDKFVGEIRQTPPAYSAIKIGGQRAYKLAREGREVNIEPRRITVYSITNIKYQYPKIIFTARVSSGTYIRSLAEDIGKKLGTGAYLSALRRTRVGELSVEQAVIIPGLNYDIIKENING